MCILAFAWCAHLHWRLIVAGNRDEFHDRPARPLGRWDRPKHVLAGRDIQSGGTWLGVSESGRFAAVTNLRGYGIAQPRGTSRGALVADALLGRGRHADPHATELLDFNPFNLIVVERGRACFVSNRPSTNRRLLAPGIYGLSNGAFDEPWPKTMRLKEKLSDWIVSGNSNPSLLLDYLREESVSDVGILRATPSEAMEEPWRSSIFIRDRVYGTRCSTVVAIDEDGRGIIIERRYTPCGKEAGETSIPFSWAA